MIFIYLLNIMYSFLILILIFSLIDTDEIGTRFRPLQPLGFSSCSNKVLIRGLLIPSDSPGEKKYKLHIDLI